MGICDTCHAGCCRTFAVPVTGADIIAIQKRMGIAFETFVRRVPDANGRIANGAVPHFAFDDAPDTPHVICLTHVSSPFHAQTSKCRFLIEGQPDAEFPLGRARCGIYGARPSACRIFPTRFNATNELAVICDIPERLRVNPNPAYTLCPRPWEPSDVDPIRAVQDLAVIKYELAFFWQIAESWNRSPGSWSAFPKFLEIVYSQRVTREPADADRAADDGQTDDPGHAVDDAPATLPFRQPADRSAIRAAA